jgi:excisionase family DNA binding protein
MPLRPDEHGGNWVKSSSVPELFTVDEVADRLHVHPQTVRAWIRAGKLGTHRVGRYDRISDDQLAAFLAERRQDGD